MASKFDKCLYSAVHCVRTLWYSAHYAATMSLTPKIQATSKGKLPGWHKIYADLGQLLHQDWQNVKDGLYPVPEFGGTDLVRSAGRSISFFRDLAAVNHRRANRKADEVFFAEIKEYYPRYYLQNFHYQSGGYLTRQSANLYDHQVEVLFVGGADAMRRQALASLVRYLRQFGRRKTNHLDVACGTGQFLRMLKQARPHQRTDGLDLSLPYLREAARILRPWSGASFLQGNAEQLPFGDESFQTASCIFLFHELPKKVRVIVARELFRVLKSGGRLFFLDSIQLGDRPDYDSLLKRFPNAFHEPYYDDFIRTDLKSLFGKAGFRAVEIKQVFFAKLMVFEKHSVDTT